MLFICACCGALYRGPLLPCLVIEGSPLCTCANISEDRVCECVCVYTFILAPAPVENLTFQRPHEELNTKQASTTRVFKSNSRAREPLRLPRHVPAPLFAHVPRWSYGMQEKNSCLLPRVPPQLSGLRTRSPTHPGPIKGSTGWTGGAASDLRLIVFQLVTGRISAQGATYLKWLLKSWKGKKGSQNESSVCQWLTAFCQKLFSSTPKNC